MPQLLTIFLNILLPVFTLVLLGYLAGPRLQIDARSVSRVAYYILAPSFVFNVFSKADIDPNLALRMSLYMLVVTLTCGAIAVVVARLMGTTSQMAAAFFLVTIFGNVGNFGFPIIQFKFGDAGLVPAALYFVVGSTTGFIGGVGAATLLRGGGVRAVLAVFKTPAILAVIPAFVLNGLGLPVPIFLERATGLLAGGLIPVMLLTLGIQLAAMGRPQINRDVVMAGTIRLVMGPALALALAGLFGVEGLERGAGVLQASMPAAVLAALIALEHDLLPNFVTTAVLFGTLASAVSLTLVLAIV